MEQPYLYRTYWTGDKERVIPIAAIDESEYYETDITEVYFDTHSNEFLLISASGCSCWDGDYSETRYTDVESLEKALLDDGNKDQYNPTWKGANELLEQVREWQKSRKAS